MTDKSEQATPPSDQPEGQTAETPKYREISPDKLQEVLEQHQKWVGNGEELELVSRATSVVVAIVSQA